MKLELEVLASTSIRRKKPWPRLAWIGQAKESIFLMDAHRLSVLYVPSGKTKRKINKLQPLLQDVSALTHTKNGHFIAGLLYSGDVFLWHKDTDMLKFIHGLSALAPHTAAGHKTFPDGFGPKLTVSDDGEKILAVIGLNQFYVWELDPTETLFSTNQAGLRGTWSEVSANQADLPRNSERGSTCDATFFVHSVFGLCCSCTVVHNRDRQVVVTNLLLTWTEDQFIHSYGIPTYRAEWKTMTYPFAGISPTAVPVHSRSAYVLRHSHDGNLVALAVNQPNTHNNCIMFISHVTDTVVVSRLKGCGAKVPLANRYARSYWVTDMQWTWDDLFVVVVTKQGSVGVVSRLGEPLVLRLFGEIEMGPREFLPLHPLISVQSNRPDAQAEDVLNTSQQSQTDPLRQHYSIATHPRLPLLLVSDGYMVTALQIPGELSCLGLMRGLVAESTQQLKILRDLQNLQMTLYDALQHGRHGKPGQRRWWGVRGAVRVGLRSQHILSQQQKRAKTKYRFEEPDADALNQTLDNDLSALVSPDRQLSIPVDADSGRITFGDEDNMNTTQDFEEEYEEAQSPRDHTGLAKLIEKIQSSLLQVWSLGVSHSGLWTLEHEDVVRHILHNITKLCSAILQCDNSVSSQFSAAKNSKNPKLRKVLNLIVSIVNILRLDSFRQNLTSCGLRFSHSVISMLLEEKGMRAIEPRPHTLHGCYVLLKYFEEAFGQIYCGCYSNVTGCQGNGYVDPLLAVYQPRLLNFHKNEVVAESASNQSDDDDSMLSQTVPKQPMTSEHQEDTAAPSRQTHRNSQIAKRLCPTWRKLHRHVSLQLQSCISKQSKPKSVRQLTKLLTLVQTKLHNNGSFILPQRKRRVNQGDQLYLEGCSLPALQSWVSKVAESDGLQLHDKSLGRILLALLYTLLHEGELRSAVELTELLIRQQDARSTLSIYNQDMSTKSNILSLLQQLPQDEKIEPPVYIQSEAVLAVVQSMARILVAYFSNTSMFVYPAHCPKVMPPLHREYTIDSRVHPLFHDLVSMVIRDDCLSDVWTADRALEYLLLSGLIPETVWFAHSLGDWKAAFILGVVCEQHQHRCADQLSLPQNLAPGNILLNKLCDLLRPASSAAQSPGGVKVDELDVENTTKMLGDLFLAAAIGNVSVVPLLLETLVTRLKEMTSQLTGLVPGDVYLPAPPLYCPQPARDSDNPVDEDADKELSLRKEASDLIQLILLVLNSSNTALPAARWYCDRVFTALQTMAKINKTEFPEENLVLPVLQESFLVESTAFDDAASDYDVIYVMTSFRDFMAVIWMLYVRDKLSLALRTKLKLAEKIISGSPLSQDSWYTHCRSTLQWATRLLPFTKYLDAESEIYGVLLSLIMALPPTVEAGMLLSEYFYDSDRLDPEIQDKLQALLKDWQAVFLDGKGAPPGSIKVRSFPGDSPRGMTLSFFYHKQSQRMEKVHRKRAQAYGEYEVQVFDGTEPSTQQQPPLCIGSRPHESEEALLLFLDTLYAVCFHRNVDAERERGPVKPLLLPYAAQIREAELDSLAHKAVSSLQKRQSVSARPGNSAEKLYHSINDLSASPLTGAGDYQSDFTSVRVNPKKRVGLFKSRSFSELHDVSGEERAEFKLPPPSPRQRAVSQDDLNISGVDILPPSPRSLYSLKSTAKSSPFPRVRSRSTPRLSPAKGSSQPGTVSSSPRGHRLKRSLSLSGAGVTSPRDLLVKRSFSVAGAGDFKQVPIEEEEYSEDPLVNPVIPPWMLEQMDFGPKYERTEQLLYWLSRWSGRNHGIGGKGADLGRTASMRVRVEPRMLVYAVYLVEHEYQPQGQGHYQQGQGHESPTDNTGQYEDQPIHVADEGTNVAEQDMHNQATDGKPDPGPSGKKKKKDKKGKKEKKKSKKEKKKEKEKEKERLKEEERERRKREIHIVRDRENEELVNGGVEGRDGGKEADQKETTEVKQYETESNGGKQFNKRNSAISLNSTSDSTVNVSSLNESELQQMRQSLTRELLVKKDEQTTPKTVQELGAVATVNSTMNNNTADGEVQLLNGQGRNQGQGSGSQGDQPNNMATDLKNIVRSEMRKVLQAQHHGVLAMLGALDDPDADLQSENNSPRSQGKRSQRKKKSNRHQGPQHESTPNDDHSSATDLDVTPLPSDEVSLPPGQHTLKDAPLTLEDLNKSNGISNNVSAKPPIRTEKDGLNQALRELKILETGQTVTRDMVREVEENKENYIQAQYSVPQYSAQQQTAPQQTAPQHPPMHAYQPTQLHAFSPANGSEPFGRVMNVLRMMNANMSGSHSAGAQPLLLRVPAERDHSAPGQRMGAAIPAWGHDTHPPLRPTPGVRSQTGFSTVDPHPQAASTSTVPHMPLLRIDNNFRSGQTMPGYFSSQPVHLPHMPPAGDHGNDLHQMAGGAPNFPLLRLRDPPQVFNHIQDNRGNVQLVPAENLLAHDQESHRADPRFSAHNRLAAHLVEEQQRCLVAEREAQELQSRDLEVTIISQESDESRKDERKKRRSKTTAKKKHKTIQVKVLSPRKEMRSTGVQADDVTASSDEEEEEEPSLNHGYALTPGLFDEYLEDKKVADVGTVTSAAAHLKAVMGLKPKPKEKRTKDVAVEALGGPTSRVDGALTLEGREELVKDAVDTYVKAKKRVGFSGMLPPDVFLGLKFSEAGTTTEGGDNGRAFINVVDIDAQGLLEDIVSSVPEKQPQRAPPDRVDMSGSPTRARFRAKHQNDEDMIPEREASPPRKLGPDHVTSELFRDRPISDAVTSDDVVRTSRVRTKDVIRRRLEDMNQQFDAINQMSDNMEQDFKNTKLLMHTVERIGEALDPAQRETPPARVLEARVLEALSEAEREVYRDYTGLKPSHVKQYNRHKDQRETGDTDMGSHVEDGLTPQERVQMMKDRLAADHLVESAEQRALRLSSEQIEDILMGRTPRSDVKRDAGRRDVTKQRRYTAEEREKLLGWMEERRQERMREFRKEQRDKREREARPFKPAVESKNMSLSTLKELQDLEGQRRTQQHAQQSEFTEKRKQLAAELMKDLLGEKRPQVQAQSNRPRTASSSPQRTSTPATQRRRPATASSPVRKTKPTNRIIKPSPTRPTVRSTGAPRKVNGYTDQDVDRTHVKMEDYMNVRDSHDIPARGIGGRISWDESDIPTGTSGGLAAMYSRHLEAVTDSMEPGEPGKERAMHEDDTKPRPLPRVARQRPDTEVAPPPAVPKTKSYTAVVRVQRPEVTRKDRSDRPKPKTYAQRLSELNSAAQTPRSGGTAKEMQRLYGTKRLPGTWKAKERTAPRTVKTYQDRLKDMKHNHRDFTKPLRQRTAPVGGGSPAQQQRPRVQAVPRRPRKTLTYAQQLQQLQPPKSLYRSGEPTMSTVHGTLTRTFTRQTQRHKPKTYVEQLQELNAPFKQTMRSSSYMDEATVYRHPSYRDVRRSRPYADPYMDPYNQRDSLSEISPWSVDDNMRNILYNGSVPTGTSVTATDFDIAELADLENDLVSGGGGYSDSGPYGADYRPVGSVSYTDLVDVQDVQDIADAASVSEGSIMSIIDWDQVNQLIADVH